MESEEAAVLSLESGYCVVFLSGANLECLASAKVCGLLCAIPDRSFYVSVNNILKKDSTGDPLTKKVESITVFSAL